MNEAVEAMRKSEAVKVGRALAEVRRAASLSQSELASRLGASISYVTRLEAGARGADVADLIVWCQTCGVSPREAFERICAEPMTGGHAAAEASARLSPEMIAPAARLINELVALDPADVEALHAVAVRLRARSGPFRT